MCTSGGCQSNQLNEQVTTHKCVPHLAGVELRLLCHSFLDKTISLWLNLPAI